MHTMNYIKFLSILLFTMLSFSCSQFTGASEHAIALDRAVETMNAAVDLCSDQEDSKELPSLEDLEIMSRFSNKTINSYIIHRSDINYQICLIQNGATPKDYLSAVAFNKNIDYATRKEAENIFKNILPNNYIDNINYINNLPEVEREELQRIDYLQSIFNLGDTYDSLRKYKKNEP